MRLCVALMLVGCAGPKDEGMSVTLEGLEWAEGAALEWRCAPGQYEYEERGWISEFWEGVTRQATCAELETGAAIQIPSVEGTRPLMSPKGAEPDVDGKPRFCLPRNYHPGIDEFDDECVWHTLESARDSALNLRAWNKGSSGDVTMLVWINPNETPDGAFYVTAEWGVVF